MVRRTLVAFEHDDVAWSNAEDARKFARTNDITSFNIRLTGQRMRQEGSQDLYMMQLILRTPDGRYAQNLFRDHEMMGLHSRVQLDLGQWQLTSTEIPKPLAERAMRAYRTALGLESTAFTLTMEKPQLNDIRYALESRAKPGNNW